MNVLWQHQAALTLLQPRHDEVSNDAALFNLWSPSDRNSQPHNGHGDGLDVHDDVQHYAHDEPFNLDHDVLPYPRMSPRLFRSEGYYHGPRHRLLYSLNGFRSPPRRSTNRCDDEDGNLYLWLRCEPLVQPMHDSWKSHEPQPTIHSGRRISRFTSQGHFCKEW